MQFKEMFDDEKAEAIIDLLSYLGIAPDKLREKILEKKDLAILRFYLKPPCPHTWHHHK